MGTSYLLDTQIWLWANLNDPRLSNSTMAAISNHDNTLFLSAACSWEIVIKYATGKLRLPLSPSVYIPARLADTGVAPLAIEQSHVLEVARLPLHHRDPFDRLIVAQSRTDGLTLLTADRRLTQYDCEVLLN